MFVVFYRKYDQYVHHIGKNLFNICIIENE